MAEPQGYVVQGAAVGLSQLRGVQTTHELHKTALEQFLTLEQQAANNDDDSVKQQQQQQQSSLLLIDPIKVKLKLVDPDDDNSNENVEDDTMQSGEQSGDHSFVDGTLFISTQALYFMALEKKDEDSDLRVDGACIDMHALTGTSSTSSQSDDDANDDPKETAPGVYLQISHPSDTESFLECFLQPIDNETDATCQYLFDNISQLIELHPIYDDDDDDDGDDNMMTMMSMLSGGPPPTGHDDMVWATSSLDPDQEATDEERDAMLERLDNLLIVPPEYEQPESGGDDDNGKDGDSEGQFDDADEDDDIL